MVYQIFCLLLALEAVLIQWANLWSCTRSFPWQDSKAAPSLCRIAVIVLVLEYIEENEFEQKKAEGE